MGLAATEQTGTVTGHEQALSANLDGCFSSVAEGERGSSTPTVGRFPALRLQLRRCGAAGRVEGGAWGSRGLGVRVGGRYSTSHLCHIERVPQG
jgi:hypothetical protein